MADPHPAAPPGAPETAGAFVRRKRGRNIAMLVVLLALVALFYAITVVKMSHGG